MSTPPRVAIVGGGTMGLAAAWALARRGVAATVLERHHHLHELGSHGGHTRIIRQAYHEGSGYVPLVQEADRAWVELGERRGEELLVRCGLVEIGSPDDQEYATAIAVCDEHEVPRTIVDAREARRRWPFEIPDDWTACFTPSGGYLRVGPALDTLKAEAEARGATFRYGVRVTAVERVDAGLRVRLEDGETLDADRVVLAPGVGLPGLRPDLLGPGLHCLRRVLMWTDPPATRREALAAMPVWGAFVPEGFFYGFPWNEEGIAGLKLACHTSTRLPGLDTPIDPEHVDREVHPEDLAPIERFLAEYLPAARGPVVARKVCLYTVTPSWDFLVDRDPDDPRIVIAGGFSGHGFKFAPTIGRLVARLTLDDAAEPEPGLAVRRHRTGAP